jgi:chemotaxis protein methyltransferase CheR
MLRRATAARYSAWSLRETPAHLKRRWFRPCRDGFELDARLRAEVRFRQYNVADDDPLLWRSAGYDIVCCRNLLMYLTPPVAAGLVRRMTTALAPGGCLFLGHTDTLGSRPDGLQPQHTHDTFYYRRTEPGRPAVTARPSITAPALPPVPGKAFDRDRIVSLLRSERFEEALERVEADLPDRPEPRDLLLYGVALVQAGRLAAAEALSHRLLELDALYADVHQLLGVCHEGMAAGREAEGYYRLAAYLDKAFAMPRLRLGLRLRRQGDARTAARDLSAALDLLRGERDERIVLFGGGFGRAALVGLCRSELDRCGVSR